MQGFKKINARYIEWTVIWDGQIVILHTIYYV